MKTIFKTVFLFLVSATPLTCLYGQEGILDPSFDLDGMVTIDVPNSSNDVVRSMAVQPDGKILLGGHTSDGVTDNFCLIRLKSDGSLDSGFGTNGVVVTNFPYSSVGNDIAIQSDGKIILAGQTWSGSKNQFALARYKPDGALDASFGNAGMVTTAFDYAAYATSVKIQSDGKIIAGGTVNSSLTDGSLFALVRYTPNGSLDYTFGTNGIVTTDIAPGSGLSALDRINDLEILSNGKIIAAGHSGANATLVKYNSNGSLDTSFGEYGIETRNFSTSGNSFFNDIAIQESGKIIAVGAYTAANGFSDFLVTRYSATTGFLDNTFGNMGKLETPLSQEQDAATSVLIQHDGKILVGGSVKTSFFKFGLTRFDAQGNLDVTFGTNGVTQTAINPNYNQLEAMAIQSDGKILAAGPIGDSPSHMGVARYTSALLSVNDPLLPFGAISVYPNPAINEVHVKYVLNNQGDVALELLNAQGQRIQLVERKNMPINVMNEEILKLDGLASGTYYVSIGVSNTKQTIKIVKK